MSAIPRQTTAAERAAQQERDALAGIEEQERHKLLGQSIVPPEPEPVAIVPAQPATAADEQPPPDEVIPVLAALRASGMTEDELAAYVAEMTGAPIPEPRSPAERVLEQVEGRGAAANALGRRTPVLGIVRAATLAPTGPPPSDDDMLGRLTAVREAKARLARADEGLQTAQEERAAAVAALESAQQTAAEGFAAIMG